MFGFVEKSDFKQQKTARKSRLSIDILQRRVLTIETQQEDPQYLAINVCDDYVKSNLSSCTIELLKLWKIPHTLITTKIYTKIKQTTFDSRLQRNA